MYKIIIVTMMGLMILTSVITLSCSTPSWELHLEGAIIEKMNDGTFVDGARPNCHGRSWQDRLNRTWYGIPLWLLVGRVDDNVKHQIDAFNDQLADAGYQVQVIAADGQSVILHSNKIKSNHKILIAHEVDGGPLDKKNWPLRLVGTGLEEQQMLGQIVKIEIIFNDGE